MVGCWCCARAVYRLDCFQEVAFQVRLVVGRRTLNPRTEVRILDLELTSGNSSVVEHNVANVDAAGSSPVFRSLGTRPPLRLGSGLSARDGSETTVPRRPTENTVPLCLPRVYAADMEEQP